ncbi:MAG: ornithine cyclodeaminase family protein [Candidatus Dormibacteria bacterium]
MRDHPWALNHGLELELRVVETTGGWHGVGGPLWPKLTFVRFRTGRSGETMWPWQCQVEIDEDIRRDEPPSVRRTTVTGHEPPGDEEQVLLLSGAEVESLLVGSALVDAVAGALRSYSSGSAVAPPRVAASTSGGLLAAMPAYLPGVALSTKLISIFPRNHELGRASHQGVVALFDDEDGRLLCLMNAEPITSRRTPAVSALSVALLARAESRILAVLGAGVQARTHLDAVASIRGFTEIRLAARHPDRAQSLAAGYPRCRVMPTFEAAVTMADVVVCCTGADAPIVKHQWLSPGCHVVSVGTGPELDADTVATGRIFVEWRGAVTSPPPAGAKELQGRDPLSVTELGEVLADPQRGRTAAEQITVFKSTGLGVEDAAAARLVYDAARLKGVGRTCRW